MAQIDTVDRILDAAEYLFAERGFAETSLRMITSRAKVNLAAVNYHFGSKNDLIQAVFSRFLGPFTELIEEELEGRQFDLSNGGAISMEEVLTIFMNCMLRIPTRNGEGVSAFMRLLGLAYTQSQAHLRKYLEQEYSRPFRKFMTILKAATPELSAEDRFWRIQFMLGATAFTMSSFKPLNEILYDKVGTESDIADVVKRLVPFLSSGLRAPIY